MEIQCVLSLWFSQTATYRIRTETQKVWVQGAQESAFGARPDGDSFYYKG